jgi:hypothetical protein
MWLLNRKFAEVKNGPALPLKSQRFVPRENAPSSSSSASSNTDGLFKRNVAVPATANAAGGHANGNGGMKSAAAGAGSTAGVAVTVSTTVLGTDSGSNSNTGGTSLLKNLLGIHIGGPVLPANDSQSSNNVSKVVPAAAPNIRSVPSNQVRQPRMTEAERQRLQFERERAEIMKQREAEAIKQQKLPASQQLDQSDILLAEMMAESAVAEQKAQQKAGIKGNRATKKSVELSPEPEKSPNDRGGGLLGSSGANERLPAAAGTITAAQFMKQANNAGSVPDVIDFDFVLDASDPSSLASPLTFPGAVLGGPTSGGKPRATSRLEFGSTTKSATPPIPGSIWNDSSVSGGSSSLWGAGGIGSISKKLEEPVDSLLSVLSGAAGSIPDNQRSGKLNEADLFGAGESDVDVDTLLMHSQLDFANDRDYGVTTPPHEKYARANVSYATDHGNASVSSSTSVSLTPANKAVTTSTKIEVSALFAASPTGKSPRTPERNPGVNSGMTVLSKLGMQDALTPSPTKHPQLSGSVNAGQNQVTPSGQTTTAGGFAFHDSGAKPASSAKQSAGSAQKSSKPVMSAASRMHLLKIQQQQLPGSAKKTASTTAASTPVVAESSPATNAGSIPNPVAVHGPVSSAPISSGATSLGQGTAPAASSKAPGLGNFMSKLEAASLQRTASASQLPTGTTTPQAPTAIAVSESTAASKPSASAVRPIGSTTIPANTQPVGAAQSGQAGNSAGSSGLKKIEIKSLFGKA